MNGETLAAAFILAGTIGIIGLSFAFGGAFAAPSRKGVQGE